MTLRDTVVSGIGWTLASQAVRQGFRFTLTIVLARLLLPEDFGLLAMVTVFVGFFTRLARMGLGAALVQQEEVDNAQLSTVFWINGALGLLIGALLAAGAPLLAAFYEEPDLVNVALLLALAPPVQMLGVVQMALLNRQMQFRKIALLETSAVLVSGTAALTAAAMGAGVYALVLQILASAAMNSLLFWLTSRWFPRFTIDLPATRNLLRFGGNLVGFQSFNYWIRNADNLLIGAVVGASALGLYTRAYAVMLLPLLQVGGVLTRVMFPAFSRIQKEKKRIARIWLRGTAVISLVTFPAMMGIVVTAEPFAVGLLGEKWSGIVPFLWVLVPVGMLQSVNMTVGWIYQSQSRTDLMFRWGLFAGTASLIAFGIGVHWGALGVAIAYAIRVFALTPIGLAIPGRLVGIRAIDVAGSVMPSLLMSLLMAACVFAMDRAFLTGQTPLVRLALDVTLGLVVYAALVLLVRPAAFQDLSSTISTRSSTYFSRNAR